MTKASVFKNNNYQSDYTDKIISESGSRFTARVFLYLLIALAITAVTTMAFAGILIAILNSGNEIASSIVSTLSIIMIIGYIPLIIWIQIAVLRGGKSLTPAFITYSVFMGALFAPLIATFQQLDIAGFSSVAGFSLMGTVGVAFALTCAVFGIMALIAWKSKKNLSALGTVGYGLLSGIFLIAILSFIVRLIGGGQAALLTSMVTGGFFIFIILITIFDLYNIRMIAARGESSPNLAMVCAFSLYTDFIYIFIRILYFILRIALIFGNSRN